VIFAGLSIGKSKSGGRRSPNGVHLINPGCQWTEPREDGREKTEERRQKTERRTPNPKRRTPNAEPQTPNHQASIEHRCRDRMAIAGRFPGAPGDRPAMASVHGDEDRRSLEGCGPSQPRLTESTSFSAAPRERTPSRGSFPMRWKVVRLPSRQPLRMMLALEQNMPEYQSDSLAYADAP
jgi:hypothetical protein